MHDFYILICPEAKSDLYIESGYRSSTIVFNNGNMFCVSFQFSAILIWCSNKDIFNVKPEFCLWVASVVVPEHSGLPDYFPSHHICCIFFLCDWVLEQELDTLDQMCFEENHYLMHLDDSHLALKSLFSFAMILWQQLIILYSCCTWQFELFTQFIQNCNKPWE